MLSFKVLISPVNLCKMYMYVQCVCVPSVHYNITFFLRFLFSQWPLLWYCGSSRVPPSNLSSFHLTLNSPLPLSLYYNTQMQNAREHRIIRTIIKVISAFSLRTIRTLNLRAPRSFAARSLVTGLSWLPRRELST